MRGPQSRRRPDSESTEHNPWWELASDSEGPNHLLTTLGWFKHFNDPAWTCVAWHYLKYLHMTLTSDWTLMQGGAGADTLEKWQDRLVILELDRTAQQDLLLLAHAGLPGKTCTNKIRWGLCSCKALC